MDRRESLKTLVIGGFSISLLTEACRHENAPAAPSSANKDAAVTTLSRMKEEIEHLKKIDAEPAFFTPEEMNVITILGDIIIPKDEVSGSASDAGVPAFIEFIVKDKPEFQTPLRGGIRWLEIQSLSRYEKSFGDIGEKERMALVDEIAWPKKAKPENSQGVAFFSLVRNLVATGFYTTEMGIKDVGYIGNVPNQWNGVPQDVLKQYNLAYTEKQLKECISFT